jgi:hypothetical protein
MANTFTLLGSSVLESNTASVSFSSISNAYTDLVLRFSVRDTGSGGTTATLVVRFNGDSTSKYSYSHLMTNTAAVTSGGSTAGTSGDLNDAINGNTSTASTLSSGEIYIPKYTSTAGKPYSAFTVTETNGVASNDAMQKWFANLYTGASAISSITLTTAYSFATGSSFYLYGIKNS